MAGWLDRSAARALRLLPPETSHRVALRLLEHLPAASTPPAADPRLRSRVLGIDFATPVGLAAGFDKDARVMGAFQRLGWGFVEVGGITPRPQPGHSRPRLFRLPGRNVINRMGFNSCGVEAAGQLLASCPPGMPVFVNLGVNRDTEDPSSDWRLLLEKLHGLVDAFTINLSSPNTQTLAQLRNPAALAAALEQTIVWRDRLAREAGTPPAPLLAKISPDLTKEEIETVASICLRLEGAIATNTSPQLRDELAPLHLPAGGGLSGKALGGRALETLRQLDSLLQGRIPLIGVGGIFTAEDAYARIRAGASLVQLYTAIVWEGAGHGQRVADGLLCLLNRDGFASIGEAVAADRRFGARGH